MHAAAGAVLQDLVDFTCRSRACGRAHDDGDSRVGGRGSVWERRGLWTVAGPERAGEVRFFDGSGVRTVDNAGCEFRYRESIFKRNKDWIIFGVTLELERGRCRPRCGRKRPRFSTSGIGNIPPTMKCAGSIFKNLLFDELPESVQAQVPARAIIEGKVPSAFFLEQVGAKGMQNGDIHVADYHANLIYNAGQGTAAELVAGDPRVEGAGAGALRIRTGGGGPVCRVRVSARRVNQAIESDSVKRRSIHMEPFRFHVFVCDQHKPEGDSVLLSAGIGQGSRTPCEAKSVRAACWMKFR